MARTHRRIPLQNSSGITLSSALALAVALVAVALVLSTPQPAAAASTAGRQATHSFPRLAEWWGRSSLAENARRDYYQPYDDDPLHPDTGAMATLRALNPNIILLTSSSAAELDYSPTNDRTFDAQRIGAIPTSWLLLQVGSTLTSPITSPSATTISVADTSRFRVDDLVVVDDEKCLVTGVGSTLTVKRGYAGSIATTHASGTRIAAVVSGWPSAATLDMTAGCPLGRATGESATPGTGTERALDWLARRTAGITAAADWDGVVIDVCIPHYAEGFRGSTAFRTVADRAAPGTEVDYTAFDAAWKSGIETHLSRVRALVGTDEIVMTNGAPPVFAVTNGTTFEGFPTSTTSSLQWHDSVVGPTTDSRGGTYLDWSAKAPAPNLTTVFTLGAQDDYRLMRFGLCTTLMGDGYFSHKTSGPSEDFKKRWYDEYDNAGAGRGYLGWPTGAMTPQVPALTSPDRLGGWGGFADQSALNAWELYPRTDYAATKALDGGTAKIAVTKSAGTIWGVQFSRPGIAVTAGKTYTLSFRARADRALPINALLQQEGGAYSIHATTDEIPLSTEWRTFELPLTSSATDPAANMIFNLGKSVGTVWIDDVRLQEGDRNVYRRDYEGGVALVNATNAAVTVDLGGTFRKINGTQAPLVNDGSLVTAVTIPARDGLVVLRIDSTPQPDTTPPTTTISGVQGGWDKGDVTFGLAASDSGSPSGISTYYGLNTPAVTYYTGPVTVSAPGTTTVSYYSVDAAGNVGATQSATVRIDKVAPTITGATTTSPNGSGWFRGPVTVHFTASDALSGLAAVSRDVTIATQGVSEPAAGSATDVAGNGANTSVSNIKIDSATPSTSDDHVAAYTASATVRLTPTDSSSGVSSTTWTLDGKDGSGKTVTTSVIGTHTLTYRSTDVAGNAEAPHTVTFTVTATDQSPPTTAISSLPGGWSQTDVTFSLSAADADTPNGIATYYGLQGASPEPYTGPVTVTADGTSTITYYSVDALGNTEAPKTARVRIDKTPPSTSDDNVATYTSSATVHLTPTDSSSGVSSTTWTLDGKDGSGKTVTTSVIGTHTLTYRSTDVAGNAEAPHTVTFTVAQRPKRPPVYRFYNKKNGSHLYTASESEKGSVIANLSMTYLLDGPAYTINTASPANNTPVYRFYNKASGSHLYTASESEKDSIIANLSATYSLEGPAYYACQTPVSGATTVYRFYNKRNGGHFYTASESEKDSVLANLSATYSLDGPAFYLAP